jgi:predicted MFS family arabinose efflux permease
VTATAHYDDRRTKRNVVILATSGALFSTVGTMQVATTALIGQQIAPSLALATLPMSIYIVGTACATLPLSMLMHRIGRRNGFILGALCGFAGILLGIYSIYFRAFAPFLAASFLIGVFQASANYYRFAAADIASPAFRPKAISWVLTGGVFAAVFGTMLVIFTTDLLAPFTFAGSWAVMALLALASVPVLLFLDIPGFKADPASTAATRPLLTIALQPQYLVAVTIGLCAFGIMLMVMTVTPVAMHGCNFTSNDSSWVIQWHVLAMFLPSFFTGSVIARFGAERVAAAGMVLLSGAAISGLTGVHFANFAADLIFLGLGWNFAFIGATTLLTSTYSPAERNKAQGLNDFIIFTTNAGASLAAGKLLAGWGWTAVNFAVFPLVLAALVMITWLVIRRRHAAPA